MPLQIARPAHIAFALATVFLWWPLRTGRSGAWRAVLDWALLAGTAAVLAYYLADFDRLYTRMENVDDVLTRDLVFGTLVLALVLECVRRVVGWSLLWVIGAFIAYAFLGRWFPGWLSFQGFDYPLFIEIMTMATHGILGVTTETSVNFVWYFILFGVVYSATGGGQLFIDAALRLVGRRAGGAAKAEIVASALFGTISGSAVANVVATGIFTIPLMKRTGYSPEEAAAHEATASTGGQLMPPVMGIAAFVMAELLADPLRPDRARRGDPGDRVLLRPVHDRASQGEAAGHRHPERAGPRRGQADRAARVPLPAAAHPDRAARARLTRR